MRMIIVRGGSKSYIFPFMDFMKDCTLQSLDLMQRCAAPRLRSSDSEFNYESSNMPAQSSATIRRQRARQLDQWLQ